MHNSLITPDNDYAIFALLAAIGALALWAGQHRIGARISSVVIAILGGMLLANLGVLPFDSAAYDFIWDHGLTFGLVVLLLQADLRRIFRETGRMLLAFCIGSVGTVLGALAAYGLFSATPHAAALSGTFAASYIGGSINFLATSSALGLDAFPEVRAGGLAADNLVMACYFVLLFALPQVGVVQRVFAARARSRNAEASAAPLPEPEGAIRPGDLLAILMIGAGVSGFAGWAATFTDFAGDQILIATGAAVALATCGSRPLRRLNGAPAVGTALMQIFFAVIGATASIPAVLKIGPVLVLFLAVILVVHLAFILAGGWLFRLSIEELTAASNANCGGPTTAAAMALAKNWQPLVVPLILCGTFGYAIANPVGIAIARLLGAGG